MTVDETAVSLALGGTLVIGGSSVVIPAETGSAGVVPFEGARIGRSRGIAWWWLFGFGWLVLAGWEAVRL